MKKGLLEQKKKVFHGPCNWILPEEEVLLAKTIMYVQEIQHI